MTAARLFGCLCLAVVLASCSGGNGTTSAASPSTLTARTAATGTPPGMSAVTLRPVLVEQVASAASAATPSAQASAVGASSPGATAGGGTVPSATPTDASDPNWITPAVAASFQSLDCRSTRPSGDDAALTRPLVTCSRTGDSKYVLGPVEITGKDIADAEAQPLSNGQTGVWMVLARATDGGRARLQSLTQRLAGLQGSRNQFAVVLNGVVVSAPRVNEAITGGLLQITGNLTRDEAQTMASALRGRSS